MKIKCLNVVSLDLKDFVKHIHLNILNTRIAHAQVWFSNRRARLRKTLGSAAAGFGSTTSPTSYPSGEKQTQNTQPCSKKYNLVLFQRAPSHRTLATSGRAPWPAQLTSITPTTPRYTIKILFRYLQLPWNQCCVY